MYIDDVLSINNSRFAEFLPLIYPPELEVKETTDAASSASFLDLYLEFDDSGQLSTKIYDKRDDFNCMIINFPNMCSNIPASPAYGDYISQWFQQNIFDNFVDSLFFLHFQYMKMHRLSSLCRTEYISTRSWYRNRKFLKDRIRRIFV
jgi:hypothetical protein